MFGLRVDGLVAVADHCNYNSSGVVLYIGGNYNQNRNYGPFYLNGSDTATNSNGNIAARHLVDPAKDFFDYTRAVSRAPHGDNMPIGRGLVGNRKTARQQGVKP